jgi:FtsZ-binding cell division protein ZapB
MSEALIASLQAEIGRLNQKNAELAAEAKDRRIKSKKTTAELDELKAKHAALSTEHDGLKTQAAAAPSEKDRTIAELQGKLLARDHRDAFGSVKEFEGPPGEDGAPKKYRLNDGVTVDAVFKQTDYKAEGATPDAKAVSEHYLKALAAHKYLFAEATATDAAASQQPASLGRREAGPGARTSSPTTTVTPSVAARVDAEYGSRPLGRIA